MKPGDIYNGLKWPTRKINMTFKIKVNGILNGGEDYHFSRCLRSHKPNRDRSNEQTYR